WQVKFRHVLKEGNKVADSLAKTAVRQFNQLVVITDPPQYVRSLLEEDVRRSLHKVTFIPIHS
ncbi:hypothetical protein Gohar_009199, partial [Gossypium harknessii]|nr:hypothetical protein [Gossypium harknessii]